MKAFSFKTKTEDTVKVYITLDGAAVQSRIGGPNEIAQAIKSVHPHLSFEDASKFMEKWDGSTALIPEHPYVELRRFGKVKDVQQDPVRIAKLKAHAEDMFKDESSRQVISGLASLVIDTGGDWGLADACIDNREMWPEFATLSDKNKLTAISGLPTELVDSLSRSLGDTEGEEFGEEILGKFALL